MMPSVKFALFTDYPELVCFISTRQAGNLKIRVGISNAVISFLKDQNINSQRLIAMEQTHGSHVGRTVEADAGKIVPGVDGLVTAEADIYLGVNTADCVPLFFFEPVKKIIGVAHAGWKGTLGNIARNTVDKIKSFGSEAKDIRVAIGPHIGGCCYLVNKSRALQFQSQFQDDRIAFQSVGEWYVDLGLANKMQLVEAGILNPHIDTPIGCTSCENDRFFSYRKDKKAMFGEMLGIMSLRKS